jgi:hypothetical protein
MYSLIFRFLVSRREEILFSSTDIIKEFKIKMILRRLSSSGNYQQGKKYSQLYSVQTGSKYTQLRIQRTQDALSLGEKRQEREADHSPPSTAEVKNGGAIPPLPICINGEVLN